MSQFSVKKPYTVFVVVIIVILLGAIAFMNLGTDLLPKMEMPYVIVMTTYPGATPEEVESSVTKPMEQSMATTSSIKNVSSVSSENYSMVILEYDQNADMTAVMLEIENKLDTVTAQWGDGVGSPIVMQINPNMMPTMVAAVGADGMDIEQLSNLMNDEIVPKLETTEGVASVSAEGVLEQQYEVVINQDKINDINQKILDGIDGKIADAKAEIDDAQQKINSGKAQLNSQMAEQQAKLDSARSQLTTGESQLKDGLDQINGGISQIDDGILQIDDGLSQIDSALPALETAITQAQRGIDELEAQKSALEAIGEENMTDEQKAQLAAIDKGLPAAKSLKDELVNQKSELEAQKNDLEAQKSDLEKQKSDLTGQKSELESQSQQITSGKAQLDSAQQQLNNAKSQAQGQLSSGQAQLDSAKSQIDTAEKTAKDSASIDGLITPDMVKQLLSAENFDMPAGYVYDGDTQYIVKIGNEFEDSSEMENMLLFSVDMDGVGDVRLSDVADINVVDNSDELYAKINGEDGVLVTFTKQSTASTNETAENIRNKFDELRSEYPGLTISVMMDQGIYIDQVISSVLSNLLFGAIFAMIVLFAFLRKLKPTVVVAVSMPISIVFALALMYFSGVTMNLISLMGLVLGVGMLVDNSIVVIENIFRYKTMGLSGAGAAVKGAKQVAGAITASTLTTICVFLPFVFVQGLSQQIFKDIGLTITYSLVGSLLVALTVVPAMSSRMLANMEVKEQKGFRKFIDGYGKALSWALNHKIVVIAVVVVAFLGTTYAAMTGKMALLPEMASTQISVSIEPDKELSAQERRDMVNDASAQIMQIDGVEDVGAMETSSSSTLSFVSTSSSSSNGVTMYVIIGDDVVRENKRIAREISDILDKDDCEYTVTTSSMDISALTGGSGISINIKGDDYDVMQQISSDIKAMLEDTEGTLNVTDGMEESSPEIRITVDKDKAMEYNLTVAQVYMDIANQISEGSEATTIMEGNDEYPVVVVDGSSREITPENIKNITVKGTKTVEEETSDEISEEDGGLSVGSGETEEVDIPITDIADISVGTAPNSITRDSQQRYLQVTAEIDEDHNIAIVTREFESKFADYQLPEGYTVELAGENESMNDIFGDLAFVMMISAALIFLIMVAQFQSLKSPFIVMFTIPLAFTGGFIALLLTGTEISMISLVGFLILMGVVVNNGIVIVDFINQLRIEGMEKREALITAGKQRIRPVLMTAITTIMGLATMSVGMGTGGDMLAPMAIVTIGGLSYATLLTLFFVPVLYDIFNKKEIKVVEIEDNLDEIQ